MDETFLVLKGTQARVSVNIDVHQAVNAIEYFAENYPVDRQSLWIAKRLLYAAATIRDKAIQNMKPVQAPVAYVPGACINVTAKLDHLEEGSY